MNSAMNPDLSQRNKIIGELAGLSPDELRERLATLYLENRALKRQITSQVPAPAPPTLTDAVVYKANLIDQMTEAVISTDTDFNILTWNPAAEIIYGWQASEVLGKSMHQFLPTEYTDATTDEEATAFLMKHGYWVGEVIHPHKDGTPVHIFNSTRVLHDDNGGISGIVGVNLDITAIRRTETDLQQQGALLQQITENMGEALWVRDAHTHELIYANTVYHKLWSLNPADTIDTEAIFARIHPDDRAAVRERVQAMHDHRQTLSVLQYRMLPDGDDGDLRWVESQAFYIHDEQGTLTRYGSRLTDITERKRAERQLHDYERRMQLIVANLPVMLYTVDANRIVTFMDGKGLGVLGMAPGEFVGRSIDEMATAMPDALASFNKAYDGHGPTSAIIEVGDVQLMTYHMPYFDAQGNFSGVIGLSQDVTQHQMAHLNLEAALERQSELRDIRSRFVAVTSHEFRNPLASIQSSLGILQLIDQGDEAAPRQRHYNQMAEGLQTLSQLMDDVLMYSEAEVGAWQFQPRIVDGLALCEEIVADVTKTLGAAHPLHFVSDGLCADAYIDPALFRKMLLNLLSNAIKYSPGGGPILCRVHCNAGCLEVAVKDSGIGIPMDEVPRLFEAFHRAKNVGNLPGTGLGLSVVKEVVELHDGVITVHSELGQGTEVIVTLPNTSEDDA